jgi:integrase
MKDRSLIRFCRRFHFGLSRDASVHQRLVELLSQPLRAHLARIPEMSLATARLEARMILAEVRLGKDPQTEKIRKRRAPTISDLISRYVAEWAKPRKDGWKQDERILNRDFLPFFGTRLAEEVEKIEIYERMRELNLRSKSAPRLFQERVRQLYNWAKNIGLLKCDNPAEGIPSLNKKGKRERFLSLAELAALINALSRRHPFASCAIIVLILSGCRDGSIVTLTWNRVFESEGYFLIPHEYNKGDRLHAVPITPLMGKIFKAFRAITGRTGYVFPARGGKPTSPSGRRS